MHWLRRIKEFFSELKEIISDVAAVVVGCVVGAARYVADTVRAVAPLCVKLAKISACSIADAAAGVPPGTTLLGVNACIAAIKALPAAIEASEERAPDCLPETKPEPVAHDHAHETTCEDWYEDLGDEVLSGLIAAALLEGAKKVRSLAKRARLWLLQPVWTVTRNIPLAPWTPTSVRAAT